MFQGKTWLRYSLLFIPILFIGVFFFYPLIRIMGLSLTSSALGEILSKQYFLKVIWFTFWQATLSTILTLIVGLPAAYIFAGYRFRGKSLLRALVTVPFVLPTVVVAAAFRVLFNAQGILGQLLSTLSGNEQAPNLLEQTILIILLAHMYYNIAVVIRLVGGFWSNLDPRMNEAARVLGASPARAFLEVTLPLLRTSIASASALIFLFTFTSYGVILILGGPSFSTIETEIYRQYVTFLNPSVAGALALLQILFTFALMFIYARWQRQAALPLDFRPSRSTLRVPETFFQKLVVGAMILGLTVFMLSPLLTLVWRSFIDRSGSLTLAYYQALPELRRGSITYIAPLTAVRNSLGYAILTMLVAGFLGLTSALLLVRPGRWRGWLEPIFMLPLGASAVTLGFAYVITMGRLRTSPVLVLIAHTLVALPFVVRSLLPVLQGIRPNLREAATVLGASPIRVWREVDLPILGRALLVAAVFAFTISMGEFGATSFIIRPNSGFLTIPIAIQRYLSQPGTLNYGQALAMSTILMVVCASGFIAIERIRYDDIGEF
ncbi:MAG TPA: iron ABC transporter permease [Patescibacteria group bacterium]|nr:iron ABC transporter permease [Patescibacteria group bacterium]